MKITFGLEGDDWYSGRPIARLPYENVNYWSRVLNSLRRDDETSDAFFVRAENEFGIRFISEHLGITGVDVDDATLSMLLLKYPTK